MYDFAQYSLQPEDARLLKHYVDDVTLNEYLVVAWTGLERDRMDEYKAFLKKFTWLTNFESNPNDDQRIIDNPIVGPEQIEKPGAWLQVSLTIADDDQSSVIMTLLRVYNTLSDNGKYRASLLNKDQFRSSEANLALQFRNIDPRNLDALVKGAFSGDDLTNIVTRNDTYPGTWQIVASPSSNDESGAGVITLYVTKHNNDDVIYRYYGSANTIVTDFFKYRMLESGKTDLQDNYYFDQNGMYYSADGTNYTKLDTVAVDPPVALPSTAKRLNQPAPARTVQMSENRREDDRTTDLIVQIVNNLDDDETGLIYHDAYGSVLTEIQRLNVSESARNDLLNYTYTDDAGNWYWSDGAGNYSKKNGVAVDPVVVMPSDAKPCNVKVEGRILDIKAGYSPERDIWDVTIMARHVSADIRSSLATGGTPFTFKRNLDIGVVVSEGHNLSKTQMDAVLAYYVANPAQAGTERSIDHQYRPESGTYDYTAVDVVTTGFAVSFRIGRNTFYFGYHYQKMPTTDETAYAVDGGTTLYLLGEDPSNPGISLIGKLADISDAIQREQDSTWSWRFQVPTKEAVVVEGGSDGSGGKYPLLSFGTPNDKWCFVRSVSQAEIQASGIDLVGEYRDIPAATYGTSSDLKGRCVVIRELRNQHLDDDDAISYDLYENIQTADIEAGDGWFLATIDEDHIRVAESLFQRITDSNLGRIQPGSELEDDKNIFNFIDAAHKRARVVKVEEKYFKRRPLLTDLATSPNDLGSGSLLDHMNEVLRVNREPDVYKTYFYSIRRNGEHDFTVTRQTVLLDEAVYPDADGAPKYNPIEVSVSRRTVEVGDIGESLM